MLMRGLEDRVSAYAYAGTLFLPGRGALKSFGTIPPRSFSPGNHTCLTAIEPSILKSRKTFLMLEKSIGLERKVSKSYVPCVGIPTSLKVLASCRYVPLASPARVFGLCYVQWQDIENISPRNDFHP